MSTEQTVMLVVAGLVALFLLRQLVGWVRFSGKIFFWLLLAAGLVAAVYFHRPGDDSSRIDEATRTQQQDGMFR